MESQTLVFERKQHVALTHKTLPEIGPEQILAQAICSLISTGTEGTCFNRSFSEISEKSHFHDWVKYPFMPGYSWVGKVIQVGSDVSDLKVGDRIASRVHHALHHVIDVENAILIPDAVTSQQAAWFALAKIAGVGAHAADYRLGNSVAIIGAGPIGQMSTRWAVASGCQHVIMIDPVAKRLEMARQGGATAVIEKPVQEVKPILEEMLKGNLPDIVIDSTGNAMVFVEAMKLPRKFGRMVLLGSAGDPTQQHIAPELMRNGIHLVGAHDIHNSEQWNNHTYSQFYFDLIQRGRFNMDGLIWHTFKPDQCDYVYPFMTQHRADTMGILFDWSDQCVDEDLGLNQ